MTVGTEAYFGLRTWTGVETTIVPGFSAEHPADVKVTAKSSTGVVSTLSQGVHYTITIGANGAVTMAPIAPQMPLAPQTLTIWRDTDALQGINFQDLQDFSADDHEMLHDRWARITSELKGDMLRTGKVPLGETLIDLPDATTRMSNGHGSVFAFSPVDGQTALLDRFDILADGSVTTPKIADGAVTTPKIADGAVTPPKLDRAYLPLDNPHATGTLLVGPTPGNRAQIFGTPPTGQTVVFGADPTSSDAAVNVQIESKGGGGIGLYTNGALQVNISGSAPPDANKFIVLTGGSPGLNPSISAAFGGPIDIRDACRVGMLGGNYALVTGSVAGQQAVSWTAGPGSADADVNMHLIPKGGGGCLFYSHGALQLAVSGPPTTTDYLVISGAGSLADPIIANAGGGPIRIDDEILVGPAGGNFAGLQGSAAGQMSVAVRADNVTNPDADINITLVPKGAGGIALWSNDSLQVIVSGPPLADHFVQMQGSVGGNPLIQAAFGGVIEIPNLNMTGIPTADTAAPGTNTRQVATTAFVINAISGEGPIGAEYITSTADATLTNERVLTDTATVTWDRSTPGQIMANAVGGGGGSFLPLAGGSLTGDLIIDKVQPGMSFNFATGSAALFASRAQATGNFRWQFIIADGSPEIGGNIGSNFRIDRYGDSGDFLGTPMTIQRNDGTVILRKLAVLGTPSITLQFNPGSPAVLASQTMDTSTPPSKARWLIALGDSAPETGADAGSNFAIARFSDDGTNLGSALSINRATGAVTIPNLVGGGGGAGDVTKAGNNIFTGNNFFTGPATVIGASVTDATWKMAMHGTRVGLFTWSNDAAGFGYDLRKSRGATPGVHAIVQAADLLGQVNFGGSDGTAFVGAAAINGLVESLAGAPPAAGDIRAKIVFLTRGGAPGAGVMTERMAIDTGGTIHMGPPGALVNGVLQIDGQTGSQATLSVNNWQAAAGSAFLILGHSRGATPGVHVPLQLNDPLGAISFRGSDGTTFQSGAQIQAYCEGVPSANRVPASIRFYTTSVAIGTVEWMRLFPSGGLGLGNPPIDPGQPGALSANWKGTTTNDNAPAGMVGEQVQSLVQAAVPLGVAGTQTVITTISLTAGDWDVSAMSTVLAGANASAFEYGVSTTGALSGVNDAYTSGFLPVAGAVCSISIPSARFQLSATATISLVARPGADGLTATAILRARRKR